MNRHGIEYVYGGAFTFVFGGLIDASHGIELSPGLWSALGIVGLGAIGARYARLTESWLTSLCAGFTALLIAIIILMAGNMLVGQLESGWWREFFESVLWGLGEFHMNVGLLIGLTGLGIFIVRGDWRDLALN